MRKTWTSISFERPGDEHRGRVALDVGIRGENHLGDALLDDALEELLDAELLGADPLDRGDRSLQHVVAAPEFVGALDGDDVARVLHDAEQRGVTPVVEAEHAELALADVEAAPAPRDAVLRLGDRAREPPRVLGRGLQQVERDPLRRLRPDAREPPELVDERLNGRGVRTAHEAVAGSAEQVAETTKVDDRR